MRKLLLVFVFVIMLLSSGCTSGKDLEEAKRAGYQEGYSEGFATGYEKGYSDGAAAGWEEALWEYGISD